MINKQIFSLLLEKCKVTPQRIYRMIDEKKKHHNYTISKETAAYLLAAESGIDISKYLEEDELTKVREVKEPIILTQTKSRAPAKGVSKQIVVEIAKELKIVDPLLPKKLVDEATEMAAVYPIVYIFENSVRNLISNVMEAKYGGKWWDSKVGSKVKERVKSRMDKEDKNRWHGKRGAHPIFYTDIEDLKSIITANWSDFEDIFPNLQWVSGKIDEIEMSRNVIAHNNPLELRDITRLKLNLEDWIMQISRWTGKTPNQGEVNG